MKKVLIINLRRLGDVYSSAHLINSITSTEQTAVSMLIYSDSQAAASNLKNVSQLHVIDRKEIITLKTNKLFSDGFALEQLFLTMEKVKSQQWDEIINFSNDLVGAYLTSYLKSSCKKITGVHFNHDRTIATSGTWSMLFNDILPTFQYSPIHFIDCYHQMSQIDLVKDGEKLLTSEQYNTSAFNTINDIRKSSKTHQGQAKIIGIQLKTADSQKDIPEEVIVDFISLLLANDELIPLLIIAPTDQERAYATSINAIFGHKLFIAEANLQAVASVLMNIDLLVTPDTAIKHIADLTDTPVIEVSLGHAPFLKQGSYNSDSLILTDDISTRNFRTRQQGHAPSSNITALDLMSTTLYFLGKSKSIKPRLSSGVTLYGCQFDTLGARFNYLAGTCDSPLEIQRLMTRQFLSAVLGGSEIFEIYDDAIDFGVGACNSWLNEEKSVVTNFMKDLLGTLRSLLQSMENRKSGRDFAINLGKLISYSEDSSSVVQLPVSLFKIKMEQINSGDFIENAKKVEQLLYELKSDVQKFLHCLKHFEDHIAAQKKEDFINKSTEQEAL